MSSWVDNRMLRLTALVLFAIPVWPQSAPTPQDAELARAPRNPYDLARFVDSHAISDWSVLWNALGIKPLNQPCADRCASELITVFDPDQVIVLFQEDSVGWDVYLRFLKKEDGTWRFSGAYGGYIRHHPRRHEVYRSAGKPFLKVSRQGPHGSDADAELEDWFDLTQPELEPVFSFTVQGRQQDLTSGFSRRVFGTASVVNGAINTGLEVQFYAVDASGEHELGHAEFSAVYTRAADAKQFNFQAAHADLRGPTLSRKEFESLADIADGPSDQDFIRYDLPSLKEVANGRDEGAKNWLKQFLSKVRDTPEVRELKALLK
jgi:hypothetical protein